MSLGNGIGDMPGCTCGPYWSVIPPPPCPHHSGTAGPIEWYSPPRTTTGTATGASMRFSLRLSDEDIERIAKRCAKVMTGGHLPPVQETPPPPPGPPIPAEVTDKQIDNLLNGYTGPEDCTIRLAREVRRRRAEEREAVAQWDAFDAASAKADADGKARMEAAIDRDREALRLARDE